ncbi:MAG: hypothetical protein U0931_35685 [Vulcanimicrobiota bacterium]
MVRIAEPRLEGTLVNSGQAKLGQSLQVQLSSVDLEKGGHGFQRA